MQILLFIIVLGVLIFVHELGHFLFAKLTNTKVHSFAIGFQPTLWKKKVGETTYKLNAIPFGGYVRIHGQDGPENVTEDQDRAYYNKPIWAKIGILIGGVLFNLIFAWLLLSTALSLGTPTIATDANRANLEEIETRIVAIQPGSASDKAGIQPGFVVNSISVRGETIKNPNTSVLSEYIASDPNTVFSFNVIDDDGESRVVTVSPEPVAGSNLPKLGLSVEDLGMQKIPIWKAFGRGLADTQQMTQDTVGAFVGLIRDAVKGSADVSTLTGPVGLVGMVGDAASYGLSYLLFFTALISINLAVLNLIPFPALDGGQILFVLIEGIIRRPIPPKVANTINMIGFAILILLMVSVTTFDIVKLF